MNPISRPVVAATDAPTLVASIPEDRREAVLRALLAAFGATAALALERLPGGATAAMIYRVGAGGADYLMRIEGLPTQLPDVERQHACMAIAAAAGVAPPVVYTSAADGIAIGGFVHAQPQAGGLPRTAQLEAIVRTVRTLHAAPPFPTRIHYLDVVGQMIRQVRAGGILPEGAAEDHLRCCEELSAVYSCPERDYVSSHNDLNPSNMLFADGRPWFIDWETAHQADRYVDLAALANFSSRGETEDELILRGYFGDALSDHHRARFFVVRQVNRLFYAMALLGSVLAARPQTRLGADCMDVPRFAQALGELPTLATVEGRQRFGCIFLNEVRHQVRSPRFAEARAVLAAAD